jgi:hypothetical protein
MVTVNLPRGYRFLHGIRRLRADAGASVQVFVKDMMQRGFRSGAARTKPAFGGLTMLLLIGSFLALMVSACRAIAVWPRRLLSLYLVSSTVSRPTLSPRSA